MLGSTRLRWASIDAPRNAVAPPPDEGLLSREVRIERRGASRWVLPNRAPRLAPRAPPIFARRGSDRLGPLELEHGDAVRRAALLGGDLDAAVAAGFRPHRMAGGGARAPHRAPGQGLAVGPRARLYRLLLDAEEWMPSSGEWRHLRSAGFPSDERELVTLRGILSSAHGASCPLAEWACGRLVAGPQRRPEKALSLGRRALHIGEHLGSTKLNTFVKLQRNPQIRGIESRSRTRSRPRAPPLQVHRLNEFSPSPANARRRPPVPFE